MKAKELIKLLKNHPEYDVKVHGILLKNKIPHTTGLIKLNISITNDNEGNSIFEILGFTFL